jgi:Txe/YoeB family toxin of toxin-antitoxin system
VTYRIRFTKLAEKDVQKLSPKLQQKLKEILRNRIAIDPYGGKALIGELKGFYSMRLSHQDRIVYSIHDDELIVVLLRARSHYGD